MHSSPELDAADDDDLFPGHGDGDAPSTPRNAASFALGPASELSPPNSQGRLPEESFSALAVANAAPAGGAGDRKSGPVQTDSATGYQWSSADEAPGYEWKSNRAREEEARALEAVVDKGSMIKTRYGDPLKPSVPMTLKR
ncbi:hypothetical protein P171DRAFT_429235 [Karstenula rhodostoma CBS 690.94]|uniref:Uncharacterized protein n=1 Tax=Karstenula rhodostoma CBS 690.94 TaxID=1392251 RepID=A0A9P4PP82_9PLEO|nr:hypothetical protein P171DRAFT_429235 [Karstenula rhodostoma CBS 690.94]